MTWRIRKYMQHLFYLSHRKGLGIHSPYLFEFVNKVLFNGAKVEVPTEILRTHRELKRDKTKNSGYEAWGRLPGGSLG